MLIFLIQKTAEWKLSRYEENQIKMKLAGAFFDWDGTLSPVRRSKKRNRTLPTVKSALRRLKKKMPVGIISMKDLPSILDKISSLTAYAGIGGLECRINGTNKMVQEVHEKKPQVKCAIEYTKRKKKKINQGVQIKEKRTCDGDVAAFCIDWRQTELQHSTIRWMKALIQHYGKVGLCVNRCPGRPYLDVLPTPVNKGRTLSYIKRKLGIDGPLLFMGDSRTDNSAFKSADLAIGVLNRENDRSNLYCDYFICFDDIEELLWRIVDETPAFPWDLLMSQPRS